MSSKVLPYSPSPRAKYEDSNASNNWDTDFSGEDFDTGTVENTPPIDKRGKRRSKRDSLELAKQKKAQQSPRRNERSGNRSSNSSARNTPRSARRDEDDESDFEFTPVVSKTRKQLGNRKGTASSKKKGVTFRVPLEDRQSFEVTADLNDESPTEAEFKKIVPKQPQTKAEIRRMNSDRRKKHQKGIIPSIARCCVS